jgi:hypothetical protein
MPRAFSAKSGAIPTRSAIWVTISFIVSLLFFDVNVNVNRNSAATQAGPPRAALCPVLLLMQTVVRMRLPAYNRETMVR